ncbi:MAG: Protein YicC [Oscillospiraceae bacterium]|nr:Protein YicC [Oscillospiraceae bacterium]
MIKSMTGYGRGEGILDGRKITVEVRSVNNRYLDCSVKLPRAYLFAEDAVKTHVQSAISRGKVDVFITLDNAGQDITVNLNRPVANGYYEALLEIERLYGGAIHNDISVSLLSRFPDVLVVEKTKENLEAVASELYAALDLALGDLNQMRVREGGKLAEDILRRVDTIESLTELVERRSPQTVAEHQIKLETKMREILENTQIDEARLMTEAAIFADKVAVDEETVRLRSHFSQLRELLQTEGAIGRKLDFLIQEFNREANTIGSKCSDIAVTRIVVDIKAEIEKIREQIQNIE